MHKSPGFTLSGKPHLGDHLMRAVRPDIASNGVPYLQMTFIISHNMLGWKERRIGW